MRYLSKRIFGDFRQQKRGRPIVSQSKQSVGNSLNWRPLMFTLYALLAFHAQEARSVPTKTGYLNCIPHENVYFL